VRVRNVLNLQIAIHASQAWKSLRNLNTNYLFMRSSLILMDQYSPYGEGLFDQKVALSEP
ncbi:MAG: hypothetical protein OK457_02395, partial [Thaumarchaeota archaeon]|nr:hypothetical protein [Nitrososphaerota archaeon]